MTATALRGRRVVVTQASHQAPVFAELLATRGATALLYPCIAIVPPADLTELDATLLRAAAGDFDWLVLTSANTVLLVAGRLQAQGLSPRAYQHVRIATVGAATAEAVAEQLGLAVTLVPDEQVAEGLAMSLLPVLQPGARILLPQAELARPVLSERLTAAGACVTQVLAYRTVRGTGGVDLPTLLAEHEVDAITLTSSSTFRYLLERLADECGNPALLHQVCLACIGPVTAETVRNAGFQPGVVARDQSLAGLIAALAGYFHGAHDTSPPANRSEEFL